MQSAYVLVPGQSGQHRNKCIQMLPAAAVLGAVQCMSPFNLLSVGRLSRLSPEMSMDLSPPFLCFMRASCCSVVPHPDLAL